MACAESLCFMKAANPQMSGIPRVLALLHPQVSMRDQTLRKSLLFQWATVIGVVCLFVWLFGWVKGCLWVCQKRTKDSQQFFFHGDNSFYCGFLRERFNRKTATYNEYGAFQLALKTCKVRGHVLKKQTGPSSSQSQKPQRELEIAHNFPRETLTITS